MWRDAMAAHPRDKFWTTAVFPHPCDLAPPPISGFHYEVGGNEETADLDDFGGHIYVDGSCYPSPVRGMARAGSAIVEVKDDGTPIRYAVLPVPRHLPQTAQAAEHIANAVAMRIITREADVASDCKGVVQTATAPLDKAIATSSFYGGILLDTWRVPEQRQRVQLRWVPAHRSERGEQRVEASED